MLYYNVCGHIGRADLAKCGEGMAPYTLEISHDAEEDLSYYRAYERKLILARAITQLGANPALETSERKLLRPNPIASWEVKLGKYRVFYAIEPADQLVVIVAVGHKEHNILYIRGKVVWL